jgi:glycosyltransferase involved in cell wall biosynthesis
MTGRGPRVSVIMPFFNLERFIEESIDSVLAQTYPDWELLLIDDGSTDGSPAIARRYAGLHPERIRYLSHEGGANRGASASRNLGIREARGEYIALLDADDTWVPRKLEEQVAILDAHPDVGSLYGRTLYWYSWTGLDRDRERDFVDHRSLPTGRVHHPPALLVATLTGRAAVPGTCSLLARKSVIDGIGGFEEEFTRLYEDQVFYAKLFLAAPVYVSGECWDRYRRHDDSSCSRAERLGDVDTWRLRYLEWFGEYAAAGGHTHPDLQRALRRAMRPWEQPRRYRVESAARRAADGIGAMFWRKLVPAAFRASRVLLPRAARERIWSQWTRWRGGRTRPGADPR